MAKLVGRKIAFLRTLGAIVAMFSVVGCATFLSKPRGEPLPSAAESESRSGRKNSKFEAKNSTDIEELGSDAGNQADSQVSANSSDEPSGSKLSGKYQGLAQAVRAGRSEAIVEEAGKILVANPHDVVALNTLGLFHFRRGKPVAAKLLINRALEKNQNSATLYNNLGIVLLFEGDLGGAAANFNKALRIDDDHTEAMGNLGSLYARNGDFARALTYLEKSYKQNKSSPSVALNYAVALRENKNYDEAKRVYEEILKQNPKSVEGLLNYSILLINFLSKPKDGLNLLYKVKFLETERKDVLVRANALEKKAKSELK